MDRLIEEGVKVDCIITDPPYGTTACKWDTVIPFDDMWERLNKLIKPNGAIALFGSEPFTSFLICSNLKNFKYRTTWNKIIPTNFLNAKKCPLKVVEDVCIFYKKLPTYNPQMKERTLEEIKETKAKFNKKYKISDTVCENTTYNKHKTIHYEDNVDKKYPTDLIEFNRRNKECNTRNRVHPTQKPVELLEYLIISSLVHNSYKSPPTRPIASKFSLESENEPLPPQPLTIEQTLHFLQGVFSFTKHFLLSIILPLSIINISFPL